MNRRVCDKVKIVSKFAIWTSKVIVCYLTASRGITQFVIMDTSHLTKLFSEPKILPTAEGGVTLLPLQCETNYQDRQ